MRKFLLRKRSLGLLFCVQFIICLSSSVFALPMLLGAAPDNNQKILLNAITEAKQTILINVYELNAPAVVAALIQKINAPVNSQSQRVHVAILVEGQPVGGYQQDSLAAQQMIVKAMRLEGSGQNHYYVMAGNPRRFHFDHAKYTVIDGTDVVVGSENYSSTGNPTPGTKGNRGWEILIRSPSLAARLTELFANDANTSHGDVIDAVSVDFPVRSFALGQVLIPQDYADMIPDSFGRVLQRGMTVTANPFGIHLAPIIQTDAPVEDLFRSPDMSLAGLLRTIARAHRTLDLELMSFAHLWRGTESPLFQAVVQAARNGVSVRVLLNDDGVFGPKKPTQGNTATVTALKQATVGLKLEARICNTQAMNVTYIHNKGAIIDGQDVLLSSINWTENAVKNNREIAVLIGGPQAPLYYGKLFEEDWRASQ